MNEIFRTKAHERTSARFVSPTSRLSSAQQTIAALSPVTVTMAHPRGIDPEELRRMSARVMNLQLLLKGLFEDSIAAMAAHLEMSPDRLRSLMDLQTPFSSEIAEHLEKSMHLPGGWLDNRRSSIDVEHLRSIVFAEEPVMAEQHEEFAIASTASQSQEVAAESTVQHKAEEPEMVKHEEFDMGNVIAAQAAQPAATAALPETPPAHAEPNRQSDAMAMTLRWLNGELDKFYAPDGVPARVSLRNRLGRAQSTVSTWLNGLRKLPDDMNIPMARAVIEMRLPIADELLSRMFAAAPNIFNEGVKSALRDLQNSNQPAMSAPSKAAEPAPSKPNAQASVQPSQSNDAAAASAPKAAPAIDMIAAPLQLESLGEGSSTELKLVVARAAEKVADVLQRLVR